MLQLLALILFFYVFLLAAVVLTGYVVVMCARFLRESRKQPPRRGTGF